MQVFTWCGVLAFRSPVLLLCNCSLGPVLCLDSQGFAVLWLHKCGIKPLWQLIALSQMARKFHRWDGRPLRRAGLTPHWVWVTYRWQLLETPQYYTITTFKLWYNSIAICFVSRCAVYVDPLKFIYWHDNNKNTTSHNKKDDADWKTRLTVLVRLIRQHVAASSGLLIAFDILGWESPRPPRWHSITIFNLRNDIIAIRL